MYTWINIYEIFSYNDWTWIVNIRVNLWKEYSHPNLITQKDSLFPRSYSGYKWKTGSKGNLILNVKFCIFMAILSLSSEILLILDKVNVAYCSREGGEKLYLVLYLSFFATKSTIQATSFFVQKIKFGVYLTYCITRDRKIWYTRFC